MDKKRFLLKKIQEERGEVSLPTLLQKLGEEYKERSVRRWLQQLVEEGVIEKIGEKRGTKYQLIPEKKRVARGSHFTKKSLSVLQLIKQPIFERIPVSYSTQWVDSYLPNETFYLPETLREELFQIGKRMGAQDPAGTYAHQVFNRLLIDLSYNSARLEGNTYSLLDTERLLLHGKSPEGKMDQERVMILNHKEAIRYLVDNASRLQISYNVICSLHYLLSDGLIELELRGKVRTHGVRVGGSTYIPFEDPKQLEMHLQKITDKAAKIIDPFEQSFYLLVHISYLQAFIDVNKRTARLSANLSLIKNNLVPLSFNGIEVEEYVSSMIAIYELREIDPLIDLYRYSYMRTCAAYDATVEAIGFDEVRVRYREQRRAMIREIILKKLSGKELQEYISSKTDQEIPEKDSALFVEDLWQDLEQIDEIRLAGLGVTPEELQSWLKIR